VLSESHVCIHKCVYVCYTCMVHQITAVAFCFAFPYRAYSMFGARELRIMLITFISISTANGCGGTLLLLLLLLFLARIGVRFMFVCSVHWLIVLYGIMCFVMRHWHVQPVYWQADFISCCLTAFIAAQVFIISIFVLQCGRLVAWMLVWQLSYLCKLYGCQIVIFGQPADARKKASWN